MKKYFNKIRLALAFIGLAFRPLRMNGVEFANIAEGSHQDGVKSFTPNVGDAGTTERYLLYKKGTDADHITVASAGDIPLGVADDLIDVNNLDIPIAVKLLGAVRGTVRVVSDGTLTDGCKVTTANSGRAAATTTTNLVIGICIIGTDQSAAGTSAAGDVCEMIPQLPTKSPF